MSTELESLQTLMAFQEHTIAELNEALISQQKQLDMFRLEMRLMKEKIEELESGLQEGGGSSGQEKPPHY